MIPTIVKFRVQYLVFTVSQDTRICPLNLEIKRFPLFYQFWRWGFRGVGFLLYLIVVISLQPKFPAKISIAVNFKSALKTQQWYLLNFIWLPRVRSFDLCSANDFKHDEKERLELSFVSFVFHITFSELWVVRTTFIIQFS